MKKMNVVMFQGNCEDNLQKVLIVITHVTNQKKFNDVVFLLLSEERSPNQTRTSDEFRRTNNPNRTRKKEVDLGFLQFCLEAFHFWKYMSNMAW